MFKLARTSFVKKSFSSAAASARGVSSIGFIGLGNMGASMATNLLKEYKSVSVFDLSEQSVKSLVEKGAKSATVKQIAATCDCIVTMLPATRHVQGTMQGPDGIFANAKKGTIIIDSSTIDPNASKALNAEAAAAGLHFLDAPVSGGVTGAAAGTLTFMVGGDDAVLTKATPVFKAMGKNIVACGGPGTGGVAKLCNNLALAISMIGTSEALALGVKLGMDPSKLAGIMNTSTARCWSSDSYNPVPGVMEGVPSSRGYTGGFGSALMSKDLGLAMDAANAAKVALPLGSNAHQVYTLLCGHGYGGKDFSSVYEYISKSE